MRIETVNPACPAAKEMVAGAKPMNRTAIGSRIHRNVVLDPTM